MNSQPLPNTDEIPELIRLAYDRLPEPDTERLAAIETRLVEQLKRPHRRSGIHWVWLLLLTGGAAAAAWLGGDLWLQSIKEQSIQDPVPLQSESTRDKTPDSPAKQPDASQDGEAAPNDGRQTPLIYRREAF